MAQPGAIKRVGGAAGCGRSAESSLLVDLHAFYKREKFPFRHFQNSKHPETEIYFGSPKLLYIRTSKETTASPQPSIVIFFWFGIFCTEGG
jgi:hypothetical protein